MARSRPSVALMIVVLLAIAAAVWAVSVRTRPTFAVYDSVAAPSPVAPAPLDSASSPARASQSAQHPRISRRAGSRADTAPAATSSATDTGSDTLRHHRSENYGGYSGYGSRERRGSPNAR